MSIHEEVASVCQLRVRNDGRNDPNLLFLDTTLLSMSRHRTRRSTAYFSVRGWRESTKQSQIMAMRNLKRQPSVYAAKLAASQIAQLADEITNGRPYDFVTYVPSGDALRRRNFASAVAEAVAVELGVPFRMLLGGGSARKHSTSHPKQSQYFRPRYAGAASAGAEDGDFGLLVDDVATSGVHFERCVAELKRHGKSAVCVAWIS